MQIFTGVLILDILGVVTALLAVIYAYYKWMFQYWKRRNVPYFEPSIPYGTGGNPKYRPWIGTQITKYYNNAKSKGWRHVGLFTLASPIHLVIDLELVKEVMTKSFSHFTDRGTYYNERDDPISAHLFALGGIKWRNLRVKLTPTFTSGKLKSMFQTLVDCGTVLGKYLEDNLKADEPVDIKNVLGHFATDIIGSCAFGIECNSFKDENSPFRVNTKRLLGGDGRRIGIKGIITENFPEVGRALRLRLFPEFMSSFFTKVVEDTIEYREKNNVKRKDFLQLLLDSRTDGSNEGEHKGDGKSLTTTEIVAQCFIFFLAGFETSSTTMTFVLFELAQHQDMQDKVREEINEVLARHDDKMTYDSLNEMKYLTQIIDETLRMYPPVAFITRLCVEDYKVPGEDVIIEKGTKIIIPIRGIHYDKDFYENPEVFDPERFTDENKKKRHPYAHIPFGEGPRICIGERFGIMQTKVGLTTILKNFRITVSDKMELPLKMNVRSFIPVAEGGMWLNLEKL